MFSPAQILHSNVWLDEWRKFMTLQTSTTSEITQSIRNRLIEPIKTGDQVFCSALCRELSKPEFLIIAINVLGDVNSSQKRVLQCELLFYFCKCLVTECRLYIASLMPILLWTEWLLSGCILTGKGDELMEDDIAAIEVALLGAYQQECGISPLPPSVRISSLDDPSIYHNGISDHPEVDRELYPFNVTHKTLIPNRKMYPDRPIAKLNDYTRAIITFRLCKFFQDYMSDVSDLVLIIYSLLIARFSTFNTKFENSADLEHHFKSGALFALVGGRLRSSTNRLSDLSLGMSRLNMDASLPDEEDLIQTDKKTPEDPYHVSSLFFQKLNENQKKRYPLKEDLAVLWADALCGVSCRFPVLEEHCRHALLQKVRTSAFPAAILALSI